MRGVRFPIRGVKYPPAEKAARFLAEGHWVEQTVGELTRERASVDPHKSFILTDDGVLSNAEFDRRTEILAAELIGLGLAPGDRALFQMGTAPETLVALFGCYKAGLIPVCALPQHREIEIRSMIRLAEPRAYFVQSDYSSKFDLTSFARAMIEENGHVRHLITTTSANAPNALSLDRMTSRLDLGSARDIVAALRIGVEDALTFQLSSGSTGTPKIIPRFHAEYLGQAAGIARRHDFTDDDVAIWPLPVIHNAAMLLAVLPTMLRGGSLVLRPRFEIDDFLSAVERYEVSYAGSIGPIAPSLLDHRDIHRHDLRSLRMFFSLDRAEAIERRVGIPTVNLYGITEGLLMTSSPRDPPELRFGATGYPTCDADEIAILAVGAETPVADGEEGELCFRGPYSLNGYYGHDAAASGLFTSDGFFRSGDVMCKTLHEGRPAYSFRGRLKDNISRGGEKFSSEEVEQAVVRFAGVADAKIVAMPDSYLGEKACAFLIMIDEAKPPTVAELGTFLTAQGLARFKHPERIEVLREFPVTAAGKIDKRTMRQLVANLVSS